ncbi:MAG: homoserine kinase [Chloroflexi bacterium]|nr:homoserine kinase [Chloroflexota bacterium]MCC6892123.1 homoserine kinase [Anaerolineae bacterium]
MTNTSAEAFAPATMANLGVGFDVLGLAFHEPGDVVRAELTDEPGVTIADIEGDGGQLTRDPEKNTAGIAAASTLKRLGVNQGVRLTIRKNLPLASGLGSSSASAVAAAVAVNALFGDTLSMKELLDPSLDGEAAVSGRHADNVAPCLFGGITLVTGVDANEIKMLPIPPSLHLALITPNVAVQTAVARAVLPQSIPLKTMVLQTAYMARLIDAIYRGDLSEMARAMEGDQVIEPARAHLMPLLYEMRQIAKSNGAFGLVISGAGPTLCAICNDEKIAQRVAQAMQAGYDAAGIESATRCTGISTSGAHVLRVN